MSASEALVRVKINRLLEDAGWRFPNKDGEKANIVLEPHVKFGGGKRGFIDYLLLDDAGVPIAVLEAKAGHIEALAAKEQARQYAEAERCRFVLFSNGETHYFWDLAAEGDPANPCRISKFPSPDELKRRALPAQKHNADKTRVSLVSEKINDDYIALTQKPDYKTDPSYLDEKTRDAYIKNNNLRFLRPYQLRAVEALQKAVHKGRERFLFEMATGAGKTLVAAAVIKLFHRTSNAGAAYSPRTLFLVDRIELENQAYKAFETYLKPDYITVIYKQNRDDWRKADIVVSTIQTFLKNERYKNFFAPDDFTLVISDEAHRSISGEARAVFEYFTGWKLGLTATPKDYLKNINLPETDPRELERRELLDTYKTFGCESGNGREAAAPTFRYSLIDGVRDLVLVNPLTVDARTHITTQLLSDKGYTAVTHNEEGGEIERVFESEDFEKKFFSDSTNKVFCDAFLNNALCDPITGETGKTIVFCVSQSHAAKITQILNTLAADKFPGKYNSDFAIQVTSNVRDAQDFSTDFANNKLRGFSQFNEYYHTSKARVCVTVGMMTTGYDCPDLLNICLMRPIFSPSLFVQIKGRGTRRHNFCEEFISAELRTRIGEKQKERYKLFDFFANCEYFETKYNYDEKLDLPISKESAAEVNMLVETTKGIYVSGVEDDISIVKETEVGPYGMKIDRKYFDNSAKEQKQNAVNKKLQKEFTVFEKHYSIPHDISNSAARQDAFQIFSAYITDADFRKIVDSGEFAALSTSAYRDSFVRIPPQLRAQIISFVKDRNLWYDN